MAFAILKIAFLQCLYFYFLLIIIKINKSSLSEFIILRLILNV